eukprot:COSAG02_NODE_47957_length_337_cov_1.029412_1_plen_89_part_10
MHNLFERVDMAFTSRLARVGLPTGSRTGVSTISARVEGNLFTQCSFNVVMIDASVGFSLQDNVFLPKLILQEFDPAQRMVFIVSFQPKI